jgi:hypothetical protein
LKRGGGERERKEENFDYGENLDQLEPYKGTSRDELALRREQW